MNISSTLAGRDWRKLKLTRSEVARLLVAGTAWGVATSAGLLGLRYCNFNVVCLDDIVATMTLSVISGILAIGPIAVYGRR